tara:strand:+ start:26 stop:772 length:747 start_codon:yes stop_codon:yes gene_type:complete
MLIKKTLNYSPNFNLKKRDNRQIKFLVFHYTGMKLEVDAIKRLTEIQSEVSSHYFIKNNGEIVLMVPEPYIAWHAGVSFWKGYKSLNKYSIGIEISNPGHSHNYKNFSTKQIKSIVKLSKYLIKKYNIKPTSILGHSDIAPNRKKDPGEKFPWKYLSKKKIGFWHDLNFKNLKKKRKLNINDQEQNEFIKNLSKIGYLKWKNIFKSKNVKKLTIAFQRRFRQDLVNGKIDQECLLISKNLIKKFNKLS